MAGRGAATWVSTLVRVDFLLAFGSFAFLAAGVVAVPLGSALRCCWRSKEAVRREARFEAPSVRRCGPLALSPPSLAWPILRDRVRHAPALCLQIGPHAQSAGEAEWSGDRRHGPVGRPSLERSAAAQPQAGRVGTVATALGFPCRGPKRRPEGLKAAQRGRNGALSALNPQSRRELPFRSTEARRLKSLAGSGKPAAPPRGRAAPRPWQACRPSSMERGGRRPRSTPAT